MKRNLHNLCKRALYVTCLAGVSAFAQTPPVVPVATAASDISHVSCTANWNSVAGATEYRIDVSTQPDFTSGDPAPWINEFRYNDPDGMPGEEFFEIVIPNNYTGATDLKVTLYNDAGQEYHTSPSTEWVTDPFQVTNPYHTVKYMEYDLQIFGDAKKGGIALSHEVNGVDQLLHFVSYGGTITAVNGPANGHTSQSAPGAALENKSSQLAGTGGRHLDFGEWLVLNKSKGQKNNNQTLTQSLSYPAFVAPYENYNCGNNIQVALNNLANNTQYYYRLRAVTPDGTSFNSNVIDFRTLPDVHVWSNNTWTKSGVEVDPPTIDDDVIIADDFMFSASGDGTFNARSLMLVSGSLHIQSGYNLRVLRGITNYLSAEEFIVENNANIIQGGDTENIGEITVRKNSSPLFRLDYTIWSSPVMGQNLGDFSPLTLDNRFYTYNTEISTFESVPTTEDFMPGYGCMIRMPDTWPIVPGYDEGNAAITFTGEFKGVPNNGPVTVAVNTTGAGYNMVGNPYPSPINVHAFFNQNILNLEPGTPIWVWRKRNNPDATSYNTITKAGYTANTATGGDGSDGMFNSNESEFWVLNPGQGFFVRVSDEAEGLLFTNSMRTQPHPNQDINLNNGQFFRNGNTSNDSEPVAVSRVRLNIQGENEFHSNQAVVAYTNETTLGIDYGWDGQMMPSGKVRLYTRAEDMDLAIQARPAFTVEDEVALLLDIEVPGSYTISLDQMTGVFEGDGIDVILEDTMTDTEHNLKDGEYTFTSDAGTFENRFILKYANEALAVENPVAALNNIVVYKQGNTININAGDIEMSGVRVYDMRGRVLFENQAINSTETAINNLASSQQVLLVQITSPANGTVTKKIIF